MANGFPDTKGLPFASYDIAVYLTTGFIFTTSIIFLIFGKFIDPIIYQSASLGGIYLAILFTIILLMSYVAGHLISFISSYVIEKFIHHLLGFPSIVYLEMALSGIENDPTYFPNKVKQFKFNFVYLIILTVNLPAIVGFALIYSAKSFGFYYPKVPFSLVHDIKNKMSKIGVSISIDSNTRWIKIVEHYVANNCPSAYLRMYNYLIIYGLMRSVAMMSLLVLWGYLYIVFFGAYPFYFGGKEYSIYIHVGIFTKFFIFLMLNAIHVLNVMSFCKFNRRFFEESILAFVLDGRNN